MDHCSAIEALHFNAINWTMVSIEIKSREAVASAGFVRTIETRPKPNHRSPIRPARRAAVGAAPD